MFGTKIFNDYVIKSMLNGQFISTSAKRPISGAEPQMTSIIDVCPVKTCQTAQTHSLNKVFVVWTARQIRLRMHRLI